MKRRNFLKSSLPAGLSIVTLPHLTIPLFPESTKKILFLGGTDFVGPHMVYEALRRGMEVTLFNRGKTNPKLFPGLEWIEGNRYPDLDKGLSGLENRREWDVIIDTWQKEPGCIGRTCKMLADRAGHYIYISSIATYQDYRIHGIDEAYPLLQSQEVIHSFDDQLDYSTRKSAGEHAVMHYFPTRHTILRCGSIKGESWNRNQSEPPNFFDYNFLLGRPLILPDDPTATFQLIDVKDLARFTAWAIDKTTYGAFNLVGPEQPFLFTNYLKMYHRISGSLSEVVWADGDWLVEQGVRPWVDIPNWVRWNEPDPGFYTIDNRKARRAGLQCRPVHTTIVESLPDAPLPDATGLTVANGMEDAVRLRLLRLWKSERAQRGE